MCVKIAGCVILYEPDNSVLNNIKSYIDYVDKLYVVDNKGGRAIYVALSKLHNNIELVSYAENMGIAKPLNDVIAMAKDTYALLLTMDQDSFFEQDDIKKYVKIAQEVKWDDVLGIAPQFITKFMEIQTKTEEKKWFEVPCVITSGNIINLANALKINGFDEKLFIDEVDHDFCYRGWMAGLKTLELNRSIFFKHCVGDPMTVKLLWKTYHPSNHNYIRTYYIVRNRIYVVVKDWQIAKRNFKSYYLKGTARLVVAKFFFEKDKIRKIRSIFEGIKDAVLGNMGKKHFRY